MIGETNDKRAKGMEGDGVGGVAVVAPGGEGLSASLGDFDRLSRRFSPRGKGTALADDGGAMVGGAGGGISENKDI